MQGEILMSHQSGCSLLDFSIIFALFQKIASDLEQTYKEILYISAIAIGRLQKAI